MLNHVYCNKTTESQKMVSMIIYSVYKKFYTHSMSLLKPIIETWVAKIDIILLWFKTRHRPLMINVLCWDHFVLYWCYNLEYQFFWNTETAQAKQPKSALPQVSILNVARSRSMQESVTALLLQELYLARFKRLIVQNLALLGWYAVLTGGSKGEG